jgi:hypothetical protein
MVPGTILFDRNFRFHDGQTGEKIFVVLTDGRSGTYVTVKTTSQDSRYTFVYGCQVMHRFPHFYLPKGSSCLEKQTWLCLGEFYEFKAAELIARVTDDHIRRMGVLSGEITREVQGCVLNSDDISEAQADDVREVWNQSKPKPQK